MKRSLQPRDTQTKKRKKNGQISFFILLNLISLLFLPRPKTSDQVRALKTAALASSSAQVFAHWRVWGWNFGKGGASPVNIESPCIECTSWLCSGLIWITACSYLNDNDSPPSFRLTLIAKRYQQSVGNPEQLNSKHLAKEGGAG